MQMTHLRNWHRSRLSMNSEKKDPRVKTLSCSHLLQWEMLPWLKGINTKNNKQELWHWGKVVLWLIWHNTARQIKERAGLWTNASKPAASIWRPWDVYKITIIISCILISNCNRLNSKQVWFLIGMLYFFQGTEHPIDSEIIKNRCS